MLEGGQDRFIVRVADPDINRQREEWWVFELSTGREVPRFAPKSGVGRLDAARHIVDARYISGTSLALIQWWLFDSTTDSQGARFALIDLSGTSAKSVWTLDLPRDYTVPGTDRAQDTLMYQIRRDGAILPAAKPGEFTLRFVARKLRVTFRVTFRVAELAGRGWGVRPVHIAPFVAPQERDGPPVPSIRLTLLDRLDLLENRGEITSTPNPVERPINLIAAGPGQLAFLSLADDPALVVVTEEGNVLHKVSIGGLKNGQPPGVPDGFLMVWQGGTRFIIFRERCPDEPINSYTEAFVVDAVSAKLKAIAGFRCPPINSLGAFPAGGFVLLATLRSKYTSESAVYAFDAVGKRMWALTQNFDSSTNQGPESLFLPKSLAVLRDGSVVILDNGHNTVQFFDSEGQYRKTVDLASAWKRKPSYVSNIVGDPEGGFVVHDFQGTPSIVWMNANGTVARGFTPRYASGAPIDNPEYCVASDGRLWANDRYSLIRLDTAGRATARIGEPPDANRLLAISEVAVQPAGRILATAERTGAMHVFDRTGCRLHVCVPKGGAEEASSVDRESIAPGPNDTFAIGDKWFGADGNRCGKPAGFHTARERSAVLLRRPNRTWLGYRMECTTAADQSLAILDQPASLFSAPGFVSLYSPGSAPISTIPVPALLGTLAAVAFDGKRVVVAGCRWAYCYRSTGEPLWRFALPLPPGTTDKAADDISWRPFLVNGGRTLCVFDGIRFLYWYAMP